MKFNFDLLKMNVKTIVLSLVIIVFVGIFVWNLFYSKEGLTNKDETESEPESTSEEENKEDEEEEEEESDGEDTKETEESEESNDEPKK